tara:strand:+ start:534 stop:2321 length:1788 start_codon:yes stop_codon:yes gene_type:complete
MSYSKTSGFMDFFSGFKEAGDKYDKENFVIRAEDLKAKRDAIIEMKKVKYNDDIAQYKKDKEKIDSLNSLKAQFGSGEIDAKDYGLRYTMATKGAAEIANIRKVFERDQKGFDDYFANIGKSDPLKNNTVFKNFKERSVIDSNYLDSINAINSKYSNMLKTAKNDSVLVNAILGKRDAEIAELTLNEGTTKNNIEVADKVNEIQTTTTKPGEETDSSKEVESLSSYTITDKDRVYGVPQWWKEESKIADVKKDVKKDVDTSSKQLTTTSYESLRDLGINIKPYVRTEQGRTDGAVQGFKGNGIKFNKTVGLITNQALNFQTDTYLYNKTGEDASKLTSFLSFTDTKNITQDRIKSYSGVNTVLNTKSGFLKKDNFLGIVPFSVVGLENIYIPTKGEAIQFTGDTKTVGAAYFNALKTITERNDPEFKNSSQGEAMNALQEKLLNLRPDQQSNLLNEVKAEMEKTLKIGEQKTATDSKGDLPEGVYYEINGEAFEINDNNTKLIIERGGNPDDFKKIGKLKEEGGDGSVAESVVGVNQNVFRDDKIKPEGELGDTKFATLESVLKILPEAMSGAEIKEKYAIDFPINEKTIFRPLK